MRLLRLGLSLVLVLASSLLLTKPALASHGMFLPYPPLGEPGGASYVVNQGPKTCGTHCLGDVYNEWAYDFGMSNGQVVSAAHTGTVYDSYFGGTIGGTCVQGDHVYANYVSLRHNAEPTKSTLYLHLQYNTGGEFGTVNGLLAYAGRPLGRSGNTGYTCPAGAGYHLHFALRNGLERDSPTIEVWFDDASLVTYNGRPPVGPPFASSAPAKYSAQYLAGSRWINLAPGATSNEVGQWKNTGWEVWFNSGNPTRLAVLNDQTSPLGGNGTGGCPPATGWVDCNRLAVITTTTVAPTQTGWFPFTVKAPTVNGTYDLPVRPVVDGVTWMQNEGVFWRVMVP